MPSQAGLHRYFGSAGLCWGGEERWREGSLGPGWREPADSCPVSAWKWLPEESEPPDMSWGTVLPRSETRPNRDPSPDDSLGARTERPSCAAPPAVGLADAVLHS